MDIATLGIRVDASQVERATGSLDKLSDAGAKAERSTRMLSDATATYQREMNTSRALNDIHAGSMEKLRAQAVQMGAAMEGVGKQTAAAGTGVGRLNSALTTLATQAAGTDPVVGRLVSTIASFAVGGAMMTGVLAGVAALGLAWRKLTEEARSAREEGERYREFLRGLVEDAGPSMASRSVASARAERAGVIAALQGTMAGAAPNAAGVYADPNAQVRLLERLRDLNQEIRQGERRLTVERGQSAEAARRWIAGVVAAQEAQFRALNERARGQRATFDVLGMQGLDANVQAQLAVWGGDWNRMMTADLRAGTTHSGQPGGLTRVDGDKENKDFLRNLEITARAQRAYNEYQKKVEEELDDARQRANAALIQGLYQVGRAYGGVTDQVLSLVAATMSLERMAGFRKGDKTSRGDLARGYGASALAGIGMGVSTGDPFFGGIGGAVSGGAMTGGPYGALIGAVSGIVSGLIEQGERAKQAERIWRGALRDFALMFDDLSPLEQNIAQLDRAFEQLSGGRSIEEARTYLEALYEIQRRPFGDNSLVRQQIAAYEELLRIYEENAGQAENLAKSERELYDARFRTLNAPTGFNTSYYGWGAGFGGGSPVGDASAATETVTVNVLLDGDLIGTATETRNRRQARRGGPSPYTVVAR